ncbi:MAG: ketoacyl-ACP synthase III [Chloroflexi bacterium]|nr:ketoacyl-ACP synthase III [Chloroflexota bacterium]
MRYAQVTGWGMALPDRIMHNDEFEKIVDVGDDWIYPRTGIHTRRIAAEGETATLFATRAAQQAITVAGISPEDIDLVIVATSTPEFIFPSTASLVQGAIGANKAGAVDVAAACSGFVYALDLAYNKIRTGSVNTALVIGAEIFSRLLDWTDRKTCVLFGDGAGALIVQGSDTPGGVISSVLRSDGAGWDKLVVPTVGSRESYLRDSTKKMHTMVMDGRSVKEFAIGAMVDGIKTAAESAGLTLADLDLIVPHQANQRIIDAAAEALPFPLEKIFSNLEHYGNTSAASIPIAITEAVQTGRLKPGDLLGLVGFGGGLSWGAIMIEWCGQPITAAQTQPQAALVME